jgi:hypothetical protein
MITWQLTSTATGQALAVAFPNGSVVTVPGTHPTFDPLIRHLRTTIDPDPQRVRDLLNDIGDVGEFFDAELGGESRPPPEQADAGTVRPVEGHGFGCSFWLGGR